MGICLRGYVLFFSSSFFEVCSIYYSTGICLRGYVLLNESHSNRLSITFTCSASKGHSEQTEKVFVEGIMSKVLVATLIIQYRPDNPRRRNIQNTNKCHLRWMLHSGAISVLLCTMCYKRI